MDLASEGTQKGTPRKRALFGHGCGGSESPINDVAEARTGFSVDYDILGWSHSPGAELMYGYSGAPTEGSGGSAFGVHVQSHRGRHPRLSEGGAGTTS